MIFLFFDARDDRLVDFYQRTGVHLHFGDSGHCGRRVAEVFTEFVRCPGCYQAVHGDVTGVFDKHVPERYD